MAMALAPMGLLVAPIAGLERTWAHLLVAAVATALLVRATLVLGRPSAGLALVMLFSAGLIAMDVLLGSALMRRSVLGFGVMLGSRFYGIGNEYAGVAVAMTAIGLGALMQTSPRSGKLAAACAVSLVLLIGAPWWGANWGWSFAAACGMVAVWLLAADRTRVALVAGSVAALAVAASLPAILDLARPAAERSHIGASAAALLWGDPASLADTIQRKLEMQLWTIGQAPWMLLCIPLTAVIWWALLRAGGAGRRALQGRRWLAAGIAGAVIAGIIASVVNDTGLVAGSGAITVATGTGLFLAGGRPEEDW
jgi:hypothetical protein